MCGLEEKTDRIFILREDEYKSTDTSHEIMEMFLFFLTKIEAVNQVVGSSFFSAARMKPRKGLETGDWELGPGD